MLLHLSWLRSRTRPWPRVCAWPCCLAHRSGHAMDTWIQEELASLDLGDVRLDRRCQQILQRLYSKPSLSIPAASTTLAEIAATYRFFDNDRVDDFELLRPHRHATLQRL